MIFGGCCIAIGKAHVHMSYFHFFSGFATVGCEISPFLPSKVIIFFKESLFFNGFGISHQNSFKYQKVIKSEKSAVFTRVRAFSLI